MTMGVYKRATTILKEKEKLEEELYYQQHMTVELKGGTNKCTEICNKLFTLGQEFAAL